MPLAEATLEVMINAEVMNRHSAAAPMDVGIELAHQIKQAVNNDQTSVFPALEYFRQQESIDGDLLEVFDSLSWLGEQLIRTELRTQLRSVFAQVETIDIHGLAETLPQVRTDNPNAGHELSEHFTPNRFKVHIKGILTPRMKDTPIGGAILFALRDSFQRLECVHSAVLS